MVGTVLLKTSFSDVQKRCSKKINIPALRELRAQELFHWSLFIGAVILYVAMFINSVVGHQGSWPDLVRGVVELLIYCAAVVYLFFFALWSFISMVFYKDESGSPYRNAILAFVLNVMGIICIIIHIH